jgi:hypothetical protein
MTGCAFFEHVRLTLEWTSYQRSTVANAFDTEPIGARPANQFFVSGCRFRSLAFCGSWLFDCQKRADRNVCPT